MTNIYRIIRAGLLLSVMVLMLPDAKAQLQVNFAPRFSDAVYGDFVTIGNNMLSVNATTNYTGTDGNHNITSVFVDIDADNTTFNSSSATLVDPIPSTSCVYIKKAYLYWAAADFEEANINNEPNWNYNDVKLMLPGSATYSTISADNVIYRGRATHFVNDPYVCVKDITSLVQGLGSPYGKYQLANVRTKKGSLNPDHTGSNVGTSGGWQIVFVYEGTKDQLGNAVLPAKYITIFDGYANVTSSQNNYNITVSGFQTPPVGAIQTKIMFGSLEGDRDLSGDQFQIRNVANTFVDMTTGSLRPTTNFFDSRITVENTDFTNRNPASTNTLGYDIGYFTLNNPSNSIITNNQTSAVFRLTSNQETYGLYMVGFSTDVWAPDLSPLVQLSTPGTVNPLDTISYTFTVKNSGNDDARNVVITRTIPPEVELVQPVTPLPAGVTYSYNAGTRVLSFFIQNGLVDVTDPAINISYKTVVKDQCYFLETACVPNTTSQLLATYTGVQNPNTQTTLSSNALTTCGLGNDKPNVTSINQPAAASWTTTPGSLNRTVNCNDAAGLAAAQALFPATNKCNFVLNKVSGAFVASANSCPITGSYTNTWTFTDKCGRTSPVFTQVITVQDTTKPVFTGQLPANATVNCNAVPTAPTLTGTDNCTTATVTFGEVRTNGNCTNNYILMRTWTAKDVCNNSTIYVQTLTVQDTTKPAFTGQLPANATVNCDAVPTAPTLTATDNCGSATETFGEVRTNGNCTNNYILTRTWTATDACQNTKIYVQTLTVQDTTKPAFTGQLPANATVNCDAVPTAPTLTATDNCGSATVTFGEVRTNGNCANNYILTRTWTATDACQNTKQYVQTLTVQDTTKPVFNGQLPANATVNCDAVPTAPTLTATDNCGAATVTFGEVRTNGNCANNYILTRTWTATDACQNTKIYVQTLTVQDTTKPLFNGQLPANATVNCDAVPTAPTLTATDNCGAATVTFGEVRTNGNCTNNYILTRTWTATDACQNITTHVQTLTVQDTTKPVFTGQLPANATVNCDAVPTAPTLTATDNCGAATVTFGEVRTNGNCANNYILTRTWTATDACQNTKIYVQTLTVQDTTKPVFTGQLPSNATVNCDAVPTAPTLTATDNCGAATVTFGEVRTNGNCPNSYILTRTWTAKDACNNTTIYVQTITVQDTTKPVFNGPLPGDVTVNPQSIPVAPTLTATDNCGSATVTFNEVKTNGNCPNNFILTRTWIAKDICNNIATHVQVITVQDTTKPFFTSALPRDTTVNCDAVPQAPTVTASDNSGSVHVTFTEVRTNGNCPNNYILTRTWTASDSCGNSIRHIQVVTVQDTTKPVFIGQLPANATVNCNAVPTAPTLTAEDNCGAATVTFGEVRSNGNCANNYILTRTWTATDACQNTKIYVQTLTVQDTTKPIFNGQLPANATVNCDAVPTAPTLTATDNCGAATVTFGEVRTNGNCTNNYILTRTWTATDACQNITTHVQTLTVQDTTKPVFTGQLPANATVNCDAVPTAPTLTATDNCGAATVTFGEVRTNGNCANNYILTRTWTATDACQNTKIYVQTLTVQDTTKPVFTGQLPANATVNCDAVPTAPTLTATDNCGAATVTFGEVRTNGNCPNSYILTRTWTAKDECNNTTIHVQTLTVQDTTKPVFSGHLPGDTTVSCDAVPAPVVLTATDKCGSATVTFSETRTNGNCPNKYILFRTWIAKDDCNNTTTYTQILAVKDTTKPVFNGPLPGDTTVNTQSVPVAPILTATDNCGTAPVTYNEVKTNGNCPNNYILTRTWIAKDTCNNTATHIQVITVQDTTKPFFTSALPRDTTVNCDAVPQPPVVTASDASGSVNVAYKEVRTNGNCANNYVLTRTWTASDSCGNSIRHVQVVTVQDTIKPVFTGQLPANATVNCDAVQAAATLTATDNCGSATVTFGEVKTNGNCANSYILTRTWTAKDTCSNTTTYVQIITVQDTTKPVFNGQLPSNATVNCDVVPVAPTLTAEDNCGTATVTFGEVKTNGNCANSYILTRTWTATDECQNITTHVQTLTVQDTTKPLFNGQLPANATVNCDVVPQAATLRATDNCGSATVTFGEVKTNGNCANNYSLTRTWTATDDCQNTTVYVQTITVQDTTKPVFNGQLPASSIVSCDSVPTAPTLTAEDNCGSATVTFGEVRTDGNCANNYSLTRTWTATDICNNVTTYVQTITVQDITKPVFVQALPANEIVCGNAELPAVLTATDNCGQASVSFTESIDSVSIPNVKIYTRTWTATDACGNSTTHTQTITARAILFSSQSPAVCKGGSVTVGNVIHDQTGTYIDTLQSVLGCDSIVTTNLTINPVDTILLNLFICLDSTGSSVTVGGQVFDTPGNYEVVLKNITGCDSVVELNLIGRLCVVQLGVIDTIRDTISVRKTDTVCLSLMPTPDATVTACDGRTDGVEVHGTWTISTGPPQCLVYTADTILGNDYLCMVACDSVGRVFVCDTTFVIITVIDSLPIAVDECVETDKNTPIPVSVLVNDRDPDFDRITIQSITQSPKWGTATIDQRSETIVYTPQNNYCGKDTFYYEICDGISGCDTGMVCITVRCKCELPQVITPNDDGYNDVLMIPCIYGLDNAKIMVWNRWGLLVYENDHYKNDWDGKYKGDYVPAGTYWYAVDFTDPETGEHINEANYLMIIK